ncbi:hypothetical protein CDL15_Pgr013543 [Punica granatum]|uniref:Bowman-Birk serine protease inhibitors family domain-containing protein n=1 Tax=Punica granatum TaxID=22663 RepID=A0A218W0Z9_PUNGR|nr:hypothetical protein CDL15_Pgr013543 [Punica granatum]PKI41612.1 hypothetical protein CRG98_038012 [Punica granatum]
MGVRFSQFTCAFLFIFLAIGLGVVQAETLPVPECVLSICSSSKEPCSCCKTPGQPSKLLQCFKDLRTCQVNCSPWNLPPGRLSKLPNRRTMSVPSGF